jgi:hypothetical protein
MGHWDCQFATLHHIQIILLLRLFKKKYFFSEQKDYASSRNAKYYKICISNSTDMILHLFFGSYYKAQLMKYLCLWIQLPALSNLIPR